MVRMRKGDRVPTHTHAERDPVRRAPDSPEGVRVRSAHGTEEPGGDPPEFIPGWIEESVARRRTLPERRGGNRVGQLRD